MFERMSGRSADSRRSTNSKRSTTRKFENLYQDAKRRNERKINIYGACLDAECTFQPDIEKTQASRRRYRSGSRERHSERSNRGELFERLSQGLNSSRERSQLMLANS